MSDPTRTLPNPVELYKKAKKWKKRLDQFRALLDYETRAPVVLDLVVEWAQKLPGLLDRAFGLKLPFVNHPLWKYHKYHIQMLRQALDAFFVLRAAGKMREKTEGLLRELRDRAAAVARDYAETGPKWRALEQSFPVEVAARAAFADLCPTYPAVCDQGRDAVAAARAEREELFQGLLGHWAALKVVEREIVHLCREREKRQDAVMKKGTVGRAFGGYDRHYKDDLGQVDELFTTGFVGTLDEKAAAATRELTVLVTRWAARLDDGEAGGD